MKGDRESIKNLLEIFDGLLEYLREVSETSSQTGGEMSTQSVSNVAKIYLGFWLLITLTMERRERQN